VGAPGHGAVDGGGGAQLLAMVVGVGAGRGGLGEEREDEHGKERSQRPASGRHHEIPPSGRSEITPFV
jgi:hypothetical protein